MSKKDKLFNFSDDEFVSLTMLEGDLEAKLTPILQKLVTDIHTITKPVRTLPGEHDIKFARHALAAKAMSERVAFSIGVIFAKMMPTDVGAVFLPQVLNGVAQGYEMGLGNNILDVSFQCQVQSTDRTPPEVRAAINFCQMMVEPLALTMLHYALKGQLNDEKSDRPSSENKII